jgi:uroporphyrinogen decarboxylase
LGPGTGKLGLVGQSGADVVGLDWKTDMSEARQLLGRDTVLQGNMDPMILFAPEVSLPL